MLVLEKNGIKCYNILEFTGSSHEFSTHIAVNTDNRREEAGIWVQADLQYIATPRKIT